MFRRKRIKWGNEVKETLSEAQNHRCALCGKRMEANGRREDYPTFEHIHSLFRGGEDSLDNIAITCRGCNEGRDLYASLT